MRQEVLESMQPYDINPETANTCYHPATPEFLEKYY